MVTGQLSGKALAPRLGRTQSSLSGRVEEPQQDQGGDNINNIYLFNYLCEDVYSAEAGSEPEGGL